jgi:hypothetical protein
VRLRLGTRGAWWSGLGLLVVAVGLVAIPSALGDSIAPTFASQATGRD